MPERALPPQVTQLDPAAREAFLRAWAYWSPRVSAFVEAEVQAAAEAGIDGRCGALALGSLLIGQAELLMEVSGALAAAGGDADVAALMLGIEQIRGRGEAPPDREAGPARGRGLKSARRARRPASGAPPPDGAGGHER